MASRFMTAMRSRLQGGVSLTEDSTPATELTQLLAAGRIDDARRLLADLPASVDVAALRHRAFLALQAQEGPEPRRAPLAPTTGSIPEIAAADLDLDTVVDAVGSAGALIVRGLLPTGLAADLRDGLERTLTDMEAYKQAEGGATDNYRPLLDGGPELPWSREIAELGHLGCLLADSPGMLATYLEVLRTSGVVAMMGEYFGSTPVLTAEKAVLRRVAETTGTNWHQDGAFLGADRYALNLWVSLSECGQDAPGLDLVPEQFDVIHETGTGGALFDWSVGPEVVQTLEQGRNVVSPLFEPGDAVLFDQFCLHRTGVTPQMTRPRYAIESWFFALPTVPQGYTGLFV